MLESKIEVKVLQVGQYVADRIAGFRLNHGLRRDILNFVRENNVSMKELGAKSKLVLRETVRRRDISAWPTLLMCSLLYNGIEKSWISAPKYWSRYHRAWGGPIRKISDVKTLTKKLNSSSNIPDVGYFVGGKFRNLNWHISDLSSIISSSKESNFVVKRDYSERGNHVISMKVDEIKNFDFASFGDCVIQEQVKQHDILNLLSNGAIVTVRILSGINQESGQIEILSILLKYNALNETKRKNITIPIDLNSLKSREYGYSERFKVIRLPKEFIDSHQQLPGFGDAIELTKSLHYKFPHFKIIGWDIGIDQNAKPVIYEWNADHPALIRAQGFYGPIFDVAHLLK